MAGLAAEGFEIVPSALVDAVTAAAFRLIQAEDSLDRDAAMRGLVRASTALRALRAPVPSGEEK